MKFNGVEFFYCEECGKYIPENEGVTTKTGRFVCNKNKCRKLNNKNEIFDKTKHA